MYAERAVFATNPWCHRCSVCTTRPRACTPLRWRQNLWRMPPTTLSVGPTHTILHVGPAVPLGACDCGRLRGDWRRDHWTRGNVDNARADAPDAVRLYESLERRIRGLHPALGNVRITHRWMGPLCSARQQAHHYQHRRGLPRAGGDRLSRARCGSLRARGQAAGRGARRIWHTASVELSAAVGQEEGAPPPPNPLGKGANPSLERGRA